MRPKIAIELLPEGYRLELWQALGITREHHPTLQAVFQRLLAYFEARYETAARGKNYGKVTVELGRWDDGELGRWDDGEEEG